MTMMINNKLVIVLIDMGTVACDVVNNYIENIVLYNIFSWIRPP